jgi:hypothetical protein
MVRLRGAVEFLMFRPDLRFTVSLLASLAASACQEDAYPSGPLLPDGTPAIVLTTDRTSYTPGSSATVTLRNEGSETVLFGVCSDALERRYPTGQWLALAPLPYACPDIALVLEAGASRTLPFDLRAASIAGMYRLRRAFLPEQGGLDEQFDRRSNEFVIKP